MASGIRQELPPPGGYAAIEWARKATGKKISGVKIFGAVIVTKVLAYMWWRRHLGFRRLKDLEMNDARIAVTPLYLAESDRAYLKHLRAVRDEEAELMKDTPGWEVGTLYGEPVYHNVRERFLMPDKKEMQAHSKSSAADFTYPIAQWVRRKWLQLTTDECV